MKYLLDSSTLILLLRPARAGRILERLNRIAENEPVVCSIVRMELIAGALRSQRSAQNLQHVHELLDDFDSLAFDDLAADHAGRVRAELETVGTPIGANDLLIAGIALANDLILVTHNTREFVRVPGLRVEDWENEP